MRNLSQQDREVGQQQAHRIASDRVGATEKGEARSAGSWSPAGRQQERLDQPSKCWKRQRGSSLIEFALVLMVLLTILMGILDLGRAVYAHSVVAAAAQEGARYAIVHRSDLAGIESSARSQAAGLDYGQMSVAVSYPSSTAVEVTVSYGYQAITPIIGQIIGAGGQLTLSGTARMGN
jgi:Flp pilus assembly protein TadG